MFVPRFYEVSNERHYLDVIASLSFTIDCCINTLEREIVSYAVASGYKDKSTDKCT